SSNTDVAVVSNKGVVSPIADGEAEITVSFGSTTSDPVAVTVTTPTCGAPFTAPSGMVYNTASYTFNPALCWTTNNIKEGTSTNDYSTMCYGNNCSSYPTRGYYYTPAQAKDVNICGKLGPGWRLPRNAEWGTLLSARNNLVGAVGTTGSPSELLKPWITAPDALAGVMNVFTDANGWGQYSYWYPGDGSNGACNNTIWQSDNTGHNGQCHGNPGMATVRCVYEI
ncbi:MAG: hypothetical protein LBN93_11175, partial [Candidatus Symbiothrix sp.]|nr:hypothetical protein [Candidatus Symbiothrix sp.]